MGRTCSAHGAEGRFMQGFRRYYRQWRDRMKYKGTNGRIILKWIPKRICREGLDGFIWLRIGTLEGSVNTAISISGPKTRGTALQNVIWRSMLHRISSYTETEVSCSWMLGMTFMASPFVFYCTSVQPLWHKSTSPKRLTVDKLIMW
jgi:hypothetical protein